MEETNKNRKMRKTFLWIAGLFGISFLAVLIGTADFQDGNHIDSDTPHSYSFSEGDSIVVVEDPSVLDEVQKERKSTEELEKLEREWEIRDLREKAEVLKQRPPSDWLTMTDEERYTVILAELSEWSSFPMSASQLYNCMNHEVEKSKWKPDYDIDLVMFDCLKHGYWKLDIREPKEKAKAF